MLSPAAGAFWSDRTNYPCTCRRGWPSGPREHHMLKQYCINLKTYGESFMKGVHRAIKQLSYRVKSTQRVQAASAMTNQNETDQ